MNHANKKLIKFWDQVEQIVADLLRERQTLIVLMCKVNGLEEALSPPSQNNPSLQPTPLTVRVNAFCQILMDYVSAGHFEVYEKLLVEAEAFGDDDIDPLRNLFPIIEHSTQLAVNFNDKYDNSSPDAIVGKTLQQDLSALGEALEERFELEDRFIENFHSRHRIQLRSA